MRIFAPVAPLVALLTPTLTLCLGALIWTPALALGPVGLSGGFGAGVQSIVEDQARLLNRTDSAQPRLQSEVIVEIGAGRSVTAGAGEAARPALCPPPSEPFVCGVVIPAPLPELVDQPETETQHIGPQGIEPKNTEQQSIAPAL